MNYSLIIGIEDFDESSAIKKVGHATSDAKAIAAAFKEFGFNGDGQVILLNEKATKSTVEYELKQLLKCAAEGDSILVFFSSHGCSVGGQSYLVCRDSRHKDLSGTGVSVREVFKLMDSSRCKRIILLLDCCHAGLQFPKEEKSITATMHEEELREFFAQSEYRVAFASCASDEKSYWSDKLGHGVWTYLLLKALTGKARHILEKGRYLKAAELQDYLHKQMPVLLRETFSERRVQTPRFYGTINNNFLIADLGTLLAKSVKSVDKLESLLDRVAFQHSTPGGIKDLPGFEKKRGHVVPSSHNASTESWVAKIGAPHVTEKAEELFEKIKSVFGYLRKDIRVDSSGSGATILAKDFQVDVELSQSEKEPSEYVERLTVFKFASADVVMSDQFNDVFHHEVSSLRLKLSTTQDIPVFIDRVQAATESCIKIVKYPPDDSWCVFTVEGIDGKFVIHPKTLTVRMAGKEPRAMVKALIGAGKATLIDSANIRLLPVPPSDAKEAT